MDNNSGHRNQPEYVNHLWRCKSLSSGKLLTEFPEVRIDYHEIENFLVACGDYSVSQKFELKFGMPHVAIITNPGFSGLKPYSF